MLLWILLLFPLFSAAQAVETAAGDVDVALITVGPGEEVWERFGHNAILVRDRATGAARLYNYGIFDFDQENFYLNFARGHMLYRMAVSDPADDFPAYRAEGRWIDEQDLALDAAQRAKLVAFLDWNARPEHAQYLYEYFTANCATRVRDALDLAVDGQIKAQTIAGSRGFTYRMDALRLMRPEPLLMLGMDAGLGPFADRRLSHWDESFVPMEFMRQMRGVHLVDATGAARPLVARDTLLAAGHLPEPPEFPPDWTWQALGVGIALAALLCGLARLHERAWARVGFGFAAGVLELAFGVAGVVLLALWTLTDHISAWRNENLLLLDPLCLLLVPACFASLRARWRPSPLAQRFAIAVAALAALELFLKIFPAFPQDNRLWIALLLPVHAAVAWSLARPRSA
ncbi:MAG TPA: DUF4105 domain-containing protein [Rudaea sp.]|nr:DUF4105 domain-containing protein [Rudaea sp.]